MLDSIPDTKVSRRDRLLPNKRGLGEWDLQPLRFQLTGEFTGCHPKSSVWGVPRPMCAPFSDQGIRAAMVTALQAGVLLE